MHNASAQPCGATSWEVRRGRGRAGAFRSRGCSRGCALGLACARLLQRASRFRAWGLRQAAAQLGTLRSC